MRAINNVLVRALPFTLLLLPSPPALPIVSPHQQHAVTAAAAGYLALGLAAMTATLLVHGKGIRFVFQELLWFPRTLHALHPNSSGA